MIILPETEKIEPLKMTEKYLLPAAQELKEVINCDLKKPKGDARKCSSAVIKKRRTKANACRNRNRQFY